MKPIPQSDCQIDSAEPSRPVRQSVVAAQAWLMTGPSPISLQVLGCRLPGLLDGSLRQTVTTQVQAKKAA
jgi:hypothetical protein